MNRRPLSPEDAERRMTRQLAQTEPCTHDECLAPVGEPCTRREFTGERVPMERMDHSCRLKAARERQDGGA